jgi:hypothetical protein
VKFSCTPGACGNSSAALNRQLLLLLLPLLLPLLAVQR